MWSTASWHQAFLLNYVRISIVKGANMPHLQHHGTELCLEAACGSWKVCVPSGTWNWVRRAQINLHHCSSGETVRGERAKTVANCCLSVKTVRDKHVNSSVRPAVQKVESVDDLSLVRVNYAWSCNLQFLRWLLRQFGTGLGFWWMCLVLK